jgi:urease beta subunit
VIDRKALEFDLQHARAARMDAQAAGSEVEELISAVQHFEPGKQRLVFMVACGEDDWPAAAH